MANTLLDISMITLKALEILENNLVFAKQVDRQYSDEFAKSGAKIGQTLNIRKPARYTTAIGPTLQVQNTTETFVPLTLNRQWQTAVSFTSQELTLNIDEFGERILAPQIAQLANTIDYEGLQQFVNVNSVVGTPGVTPATALTILNAGVKLNNNAAPYDENARALVVNPIAQATMVDALKGLFNAQTEIADQYKMGTMGRALGFKWGMDQNVGVATVGTYGGTPLTNGANQTGSSLITDGWTATTTVLNVGDVFTIANVFAVNPQNYQSTGQLQQFVVTATTVTDGSGNSTIAIYPAISAATGAGSANTNPNATVNALPADNATITVYGASTTVTPQNLAFHKEAFTLATADLQIPDGVDMAARKVSKKLGVSMRMVRSYDINNDRWPCRIDVLGGWATLRPELACRIAG